MKMDLKKDFPVEKLERTPAPVIELDEKQRIDGMNRAAAALFLKLYPDKEESDFYGKAVSDYIDTSDESQNFVWGVCTCTINGQFFHAISFDSMDDDNKEKRSVLLLEDTEQKDWEKQANVYEDLSKHFEEILEGSFDGILVTDKDGKVLFVNSSYERVAEIKKSEIEGKYMRDLINPVWMPESVAHIVAKEKTVVSKRQVVKSGRHIMVTGRPIFKQEE